MIYWRHTYYKMHSLKKWVHQLLLISDLIIWLLLDYFLWKPCTTPAFDVIFEKSASSLTIPAWWPYKWVKLKIVANSFLAELRKVFFSFSFLVIFLFHSPTSSRFSSTNHPQCLKISQKVPFKTKFTFKVDKNGPIWRVFANGTQTVLPDRSLCNRTKNW